MTRLELERAFAQAALKYATTELELTDREIGEALGVDRKTIYRWRKDESVPAPEQRRQMEKLTQLKWLLDSAFRSSERGKQWLHQAVPSLKGRTPMSVLTAGDLDGVLAVLATHVSGAHI